MAKSNGVAWGLVVALAVVLGSEPCAAADLFSTIAKRGTAAPKLDEAIARLPMPPNEPPQFWSRIANDPTYSRYHRRRAVFQLFRRHIHVGMRLSEVAHLLNRPTWLHASDIVEIKYILGKIPVRTDPRDTVFVLLVPPVPRQNTAAIYVRVTGKIAQWEFRSLLLGTGKARLQTENASIAEFALCDGPRGQPCDRYRASADG